jgi:hypothetical protein
LQNIPEEKNIKGKITSCTCKKNANNKLDNRHNIDILLDVQTDNKQKYIFITENKKNAELSCSEYKGRIRTQIEKYYKEIEKDTKEGDLSEYQPIFVFLCAHDFYLEYSLKTHIDNKKGYQDTITVELPDGKLIENAELDNKSEEWLLQNFRYSIKEYSSLVKILYKNLNKEYNSVFDSNGFIKSSQYSKFLFEVFKELCNQKGDNNLKNFINYIICEEPKEITDSEIIFYLDIKEKTEKDFPKIRSSKLFFYDNFKEKENILIEILCQFIEYWELHYEMGHLLDNVEGYSKIIDSKYILDVCTELNENKSIMINSDFPNEVRKIIKEAVLYKIFDALKIVLKNNDFKNIKSNIDILFNEKKNFKNNLKDIFNDNLSDEDKKYIYWDNHVLLFENNDNYYIYYDVDKDEIKVLNKNDKNFSFRVIKNPLINMPNEQLEQIADNLQKFKMRYK